MIVLAAHVQSTCEEPRILLVLTSQAQFSVWSFPFSKDNNCRERLRVSAIRRESTREERVHLFSR